MARSAFEGPQRAARTSTAELGEARRDADGQQEALPDMWKSGQSLIKPGTKLVNAAFAGELSGNNQLEQHWQAFEHGLFTVLRLLEAIQTSGDSLGDIVNEMPTVHSNAELRFSVPPSRKFAVVADIQHRLQAAGQAMDSAEAVGVFRPQGQWLIGPSDRADLMVECGEAARGTSLALLLIEM